MLLLNAECYFCKSKSRTGRRQTVSLGGNYVGAKGQQTVHMSAYPPQQVKLQSWDIHYRHCIASARQSHHLTSSQRVLRPPSASPAVADLLGLPAPVVSRAGVPGTAAERQRGPWDGGGPTAGRAGSLGRRWTDSGASGVPVGRPAPFVAYTERPLP